MKKEREQKGFTLIEITIVLVLIGILVVMVLPIYRSGVIRAKEAVLKENLFQIRDAINKYYYDKKKYPSSLEDLVAAKYLRIIPYDPIAKTYDWQLIHFEPEESEDFDPEIAEGIIDVKTTMQGQSLDGKDFQDF